MEIRRLTIDDYEGITNLWAKAKLPFKPRGRDSKKAIAAQIAVNPQFLGAFEDNALVGAVIVTSDTRKGWINRLAVDPGYRRHGVAKALIAESERALSDQGIGIFCVLVDGSNIPSKELFKECGYCEHADIIYYSKHKTNDV